VTVNELTRIKQSNLLYYGWFIKCGYVKFRDGKSMLFP
jgi:hypothetical protein